MTTCLLYQTTLQLTNSMHVYFFYLYCSVNYTHVVHMRTTVYIFFYVVCCLDIFKLLTTLININVSRPITFVLFYKINVHFQDVLYRYVTPCVHIYKLGRHVVYIYTGYMYMYIYRCIVLKYIVCTLYAYILLCLVYSSHCTGVIY